MARFHASPSSATVRDSPVRARTRDRSQSLRAPRGCAGNRALERTTRDDLAAIGCDGNDHADVACLAIVVARRAPRASARPGRPPPSGRVGRRRPPSADASIPESSPTAHALDGACARPQRALMRALSSYVAPFSGGESPASSSSISHPGRADVARRACAGCPTRGRACGAAPPVSERRRLRTPPAGRRRAGRSHPPRGRAADRAARARTARARRSPAPRQPAVPGHHDVHVGLGRGVLT